MIMNISELMATNSSRDAVHVMLDTQHAFLMCVNLSTVVMNTVGVVASLRTRYPLATPEILITTSAFIDLVCGLAGLNIDILYYAGAVKCSGSCELTFYLDPEPSHLITWVRYSTDVCRSAHYTHILIRTIHHWVFITRPLVYPRLARRRVILTAHGVTWLLCILANLPSLLQGLIEGSDEIYYNFRIFMGPIYHTLYASVVFFLYCIMARTILRQIQQITRLEEMKSRLHAEPKEMSKRTKRSQNKKNLYVVQMFLLIFGTFVITMSPSVYIRAFRAELPANLSTLAAVLALDTLLATHYVITFVVAATKSKPFNQAIRELYISVKHSVVRDTEMPHALSFISSAKNQSES